MKRTGRSGCALAAWIAEAGARDRRGPASPSSRRVAAGLGPDALALSSEDALLVRVALPLGSHRQRQAAVGFAIEDLIAEPLDASHVVLGPELARRVSCRRGAPRRDGGMRGGRASASGWSRTCWGCRSRPQGGCSVREVDGRVLARRADGTGFATRAAAFETFWRAERRAADRALRRAAARRRPGQRDRADARGAPRRRRSAFDLLAGTHARDDDGAARRWRARRDRRCAGARRACRDPRRRHARAASASRADREAALRAAIAAAPAGPAGDGLPLDVALRRAMPTARRRRGGFLPAAGRRCPTRSSRSRARSRCATSPSTRATAAWRSLVEAPDLADAAAGRGRAGRGRARRSRRASPPPATAPPRRAT